MSASQDRRLTKLGITSMHVRTQAICAGRISRLADSRADTNTRLPKQEMDRMNRTSILLNDEEGGYFVTLDVFHQLHCLNEIRKQIYRDHYPTQHSQSEQLEHADHCVDMLRQVLMCHGDVSIQTYEWIDDYRWPWPRFHTEHECRNWDAITEWAGQRYIGSIIGPIFTHPTLGTFYSLPCLALIPQGSFLNKASLGERRTSSESYSALHCNIHRTE